MTSKSYDFRVTDPKEGYEFMRHQAGRLVVERITLHATPNLRDGVNASEQVFHLFGCGQTKKEAIKAAEQNGH